MDTEKLLQEQERFQRFLKVDPNNTGILKSLADIAQTLGDKAQAHQLLQQLCELEPDNPEYAFELGSLLLSQGEYADAEMIFQQLVDGDHKEAGIIHNLAYAKLELKNYDDAIELIKAQTEEELPELDSLLARAYHHTGDLDLAIELGEKAAAARPKHPHTLGALALSHFDKGNYAEAQQWAKAALELDSDNHQALIIDSAIAIEEQRFSDAQAPLETVVKKYPNSGRGWFSLGLSYLGAQRHADAIDSIKQGIELMPQFLGGYNMLAWVYMITDRLDEAEQTLLQANEIDPNLGDTYGGLAVVYALKNMPVECKKNIVTARRLDKNSFSAAFAAALLEESKGKRESSQKIMQEIMSQKISIGAKQTPTSILDIAKNSLPK